MFCSTSIAQPMGSAKRYYMLRPIVIFCFLFFNMKSSAVNTSILKYKQLQIYIKRFVAAGLLIPSITLNPVVPQAAFAAQQIEVSSGDLNRLKLGLREITYLVDNWDEKTTYCNFGEFQRELLLPENKAKLLDAAKEFSLWDYDKSKTMNVMCKRDPQVVRLVKNTFRYNNSKSLETIILILFVTNLS